MSYLLVALGGGLGAVARFACGHMALKLLGPDFPFGTVFVNAVGSLLMGVLISVLALRIDGHPEIRLFLAVGVLGGFTTFSTFSLDTVVLVERGAIASAALYVLGSVIVSIVFLFGGMRAMRWILN